MGRYKEEALEKIRQEKEDRKNRIENDFQEVEKKSVKERMFGTTLEDAKEKIESIKSSETTDKKMSEHIITKKKIKSAIKTAKEKYPDTVFAKQSKALKKSVLHPSKMSAGRSERHQEIMDYNDVLFFGPSIISGQQSTGFGQEIERQKKSVTEFEPRKKMSAKEWSEYDKTRDKDTTKLSREEYEMLQMSGVNKKGKKSRHQGWELFTTETLNDGFDMGNKSRDISKQRQQEDFIINYFPGLGKKPVKKNLNNKQKKEI